MPVSPLPMFSAIFVFFCFSFFWLLRERKSMLTSAAPQTRLLVTSLRCTVCTEWTWSFVYFIHFVHEQSIPTYHVYSKSWDPTGPTSSWRTFEPLLTLSFTPAVSWPGQWPDKQVASALDGQIVKESKKCRKKSQNKSGRKNLPENIHQIKVLLLQQEIWEKNTESNLDFLRQIHTNRRDTELRKVKVGLAGLGSLRTIWDIRNRNKNHLTSQTRDTEWRKVKVGLGGLGSEILETEIKTT